MVLKTLLFHVLILMSINIYAQSSETIYCDSNWLCTISYNSLKEMARSKISNKHVGDKICQYIKNKEYNLFFDAVTKFQGNSIKFNFSLFDTSLINTLSREKKNELNVLNVYCVHLDNPLSSTGAINFYKPQKKMRLSKFIELFIFILNTTASRNTANRL